VLAAQPAGWLADWTHSLEAQGCIAPGEGWVLASQIVQSVPLDPGVAFHLLHPNLVDFVPGLEIQVNSPVLRGGAAPDSAPIVPPAGASPSGGGLDFTLRSTPALLGYETDRYAVRSRSSGAGVEIVTLSAERHLQGQTEPLPKPSTNYIHFPPDARFYRLFYKNASSRFTALIIAARSLGELEQQVGQADSDLASCDQFEANWCVAIPKLTAFNLVVPAKVNGKDTEARYGATIRELIRNAGEMYPELVLPTLTVFRNFHGRPVNVEFDRASPAILGLILTGGEMVSWQ